jgi:CRP-like cAMP-binding protein
MKKGEVGTDAYVIVRGQVEIIDDIGNVLGTLRDGSFFGEIALLAHTTRTATVRAKTSCDLMVLDKPSFDRILKDHPQFAERVRKIAKERYNLDLATSASS